MTLDMFFGPIYELNELRRIVRRQKLITKRMIECSKSAKHSHWFSLREFERLEKEWGEYIAEILPPTVASLNYYERIYAEKVREYLGILQQIQSVKNNESFSPES